LTERLAPRPVPIPDKPEAPPPPPPPPPQVVARPAPETAVPPPRPAAPPPEAPREVPRETPKEALREPLPFRPPERGGLILGGPSQSSRTLPPASSEPTTKRGPGLSIRDQLASIGSKYLGETGEAKRTINLDDRQPDFLPYLERLKRRVYNVWTYPEEAGLHGLGGEVQLIFTLNKGGSLTSLRLVQSSGFPVLDDESLRAIRMAAPYDPLPPQMGDEPINIRATFQYISPARARRY
jgi:TonB family protein